MGYYKFNDTSGVVFTDDLGSNNGIYNGAPTLGEIGLIETSVNFGNTGSDQYAILTNADDFSFSDGLNDIPFSISLWVNPVGGTSFDIINKYNTIGDNREWELYSSSGTLWFKLYSEGLDANRFNSKGTDVVVAGSGWNHVVVAYDGSGNVSGLKLYYNNVLQLDSGDNAWETGSYTKIKQTTQDVWIGNEEGDLSAYNFNIDELCIWKNRELSEIEISEIYNNGNGLNLT